MDRQGVVFITGGARRIGRQVVLALAESGYDVAIHAHTSFKEAEKLSEKVQGLGRRSVVLKANLSHEDEIVSLLGKASKILGDVTVLINNASVFQNDSLETMSKTSWDKHIAANLRAPLLLSQQFVKALPKGTQGNIINMLDYAVWNLPSSFFSYIISKSALWTATQTMALQLAPQVRVNAIGPGHSLPNEKETPESFARAVKKTPLKISADPEELANAVKYILSTPSLTGQMLALDAGKHLLGAEFY